MAGELAERDDDLELLRESTRGFLAHNYPLARVRAGLDAPLHSFAMTGAQSPNRAGSAPRCRRATAARAATCSTSR